MSVLFKGMEMPKSCRECPCYHKHYDSGWYDYLSCDASKTIFNDGYSQKTIVINPDKERLPNCPAYEINSPFDYQRFVDSVIREIIGEEEEK